MLTELRLSASLWADTRCLASLSQCALGGLTVLTLDTLPIPFGSRALEVSTRAESPSIYLNGLGGFIGYGIRFRIQVRHKMSLLGCHQQTSVHPACSISVKHPHLLQGSGACQFWGVGWR